MLSGANPILTLAVVLVAGVLGGNLAARLRLPAVTGQILIGIVIGHSGLALFDPQAIEGLRPFTYFALGLIAVGIGGHLGLQRLRNAGTRLFLLVCAESIITPLLVLGATLAIGLSWPAGVLLAALAVSTAPATVIAVIKEARASGVFTKTLIAAVALNNLACICLFEVAHIAARIALDPHTTHTVAGALVAPFRNVCAAALLGAVGAGLLLAATRRVVRPDRVATASMIAILTLCGLALHLEVSFLLTCMFLGVFVANLAPEKEQAAAEPFADFEGAILAVFFTLAGMELNLGYFALAALPVAVVFASRVAGKVTSAWLAMWLAGATWRIRRYLGIALVPQAGVAVGLMLLLQDDPVFMPIENVVLTVGLTVVALDDIVGPILARTALARAGDAGKDRRRLIDFLREECIIIDFEARTKEEAIAQLTGRLIQTHRLAVDRETLLKSILEREKEMSTCVGSGLAVPHGELEEGSEMVGVMGISREGLALETPDGEPVHCMVLLATPASERDRHLEVLAALARVIGSDPNIRRQLYNAKSPAHAYELLHAEEAEGFNYFLEQPS